MHSRLATRSCTLRHTLHQHRPLTKIQLLKDQIYIPLTYALDLQGISQGHMSRAYASESAKGQRERPECRSAANRR